MAIFIKMQIDSSKMKSPEKGEESRVTLPPTAGSDSQYDFEDSSLGLAEFLGAASLLHPRRVKLSAWAEHVPFALWLTKELRPRFLVELGSEWGTSYAAFCQAVQIFELETRCYAVDTWRGDAHTGVYDETVFSDVSVHNDEFYSGFSTLIRSTFDEAANYFVDGSIDLLHIDGYHTYEAVRNDFERWFPKLSSRAVVLFHDINVRKMDFGVFKFWEELKARWPSFEFIHGHGLGVLGVGKDNPEKIHRLFEADHRSAVASTIRAAYANLGKNIRLRMLAEEQQAVTQRRIDEADNRLAEFQKQASEAEHRQTELRMRAGEAERRQAELQMQATRRDAELKAEINLRNEEIARIESRANGSSERFIKLERETARQHSASERKLRLVRSSRSWRMTAFFRRIEHLCSWKAGLFANIKTESVLFMWRIRLHLPETPRLKNLKEQIDRISKEGMLQAEWYTDRYEQMPGVVGHPILHYLLIGAQSGCNPNPVFDTCWYLQQHPEVATTRINPLYHYIVYGVKYRFSPGPVFNLESYYAENPELYESGINPLKHYFLEAHRAGLSRQTENDSHPTTPAHLAEVSPWSSAQRVTASRPAISILESVRRAYLDSLKAMILNSVYYPGDHVPEGRVWPECQALSMIGRKRLNNVEELAVDCLNRNVPGNFIEAGIWKGGVIGLIAGILRAYDVRDRIVFGADSFQGIPPAKPELYPADAVHVGCETFEILKNNSREEVENLLRRLGVWDFSEIRLLEGWFNDTLPAIGNVQFCLVRLDGDTYESTSQAIKSLEPKLSPGGYIIVDDYHSWAGCKAAVDEYRKVNNITAPIRDVDWTAAYWMKS